jgi:hypothetical protein
MNVKNGIAPHKNFNLHFFQSNPFVMHYSCPPLIPPVYYRYELFFIAVNHEMRTNHDIVS